MDYKTIEQLLDEIYAEITKKKYVKSVSVKIEGPILKCRIYLNNSFISVFFNEETKTTAFTLIKENRRAFGIDKDSLRGWHKHPIDKLNAHPPCQETKFRQFLRQIEDIMEKDGALHTIPRKPTKEMKGFVKGIDTSKLRDEEERF